MMKRTAVLLALCVPLAACSSVKRELGVGRNSPDEFAVVKRAPLTLPPEYDLRPPAAQGAPVASEASNHARTALMGAAPATQAAGDMGGDAAFFDKLGVGQANPDIRATLESENTTLAVENATLVDKLKFWKDGEETPNPARVPNSVVDASEEKSRLEKVKEEGRPVNDGKIPTIEKKKGTLDKIF